MGVLFKFIRYISYLEMGAAKDERARRKAGFGRRLTGFLRSWLLVCMDLGFAIINAHVLY